MKNIIIRVNVKNSYTNTNTGGAITTFTDNSALKEYLQTEFAGKIEMYIVRDSDELYQLIMTDEELMYMILKFEMEIIEQYSK
jgi:hypothetical protein